MNFHCFKHFSSVSPAAGHYVITKSLRSVFLAIMGLLPRKAFWWWSLWIKTKQANLVPKILPKKRNYCLILFGILHIYKIAFQLWWHLGRPARCRGWASCNLVQSQMKKRCFVRVSTCKVWTLYMHCFKKFQSIHPETSLYIYIYYHVRLFWTGFWYHIGWMGHTLVMQNVSWLFPSQVLEHLHCTVSCWKRLVLGHLGLKDW